jgi:hypothetical protein
MQRDPAEEGLNLYEYVQSSPTDQRDPSGLATDAEIVEEFQSLIKWARTVGYNQSADNLEYFLGARGGVKPMDWNWLRSNGEVTDAEKTNQQRFEQKTIMKAAQSLKAGDTTTIQDYWDRTLEGSGNLYYASGSSTITSTGKFMLKRTGDTVEVQGVVDHYWWDSYDWHPGLSAWIPGKGNIPDSHGAQLKKSGKAAEFFMESFWTQKMSGTICLKKGEESSNFTWDAPTAGSSGLAKSKAAQKGFGGAQTSAPPNSVVGNGGDIKVPPVGRESPNRPWYCFW